MTERKINTIEKPKEKSELKNDLSLSSIFEYEKLKYKSKGVYLVYSILLKVVFFLYVPYIIAYFIPNEAQIEANGTTKGKVTFWVLTFFHWFTFLSVNSFYVYLYFFQPEWSKKYKVGNDPWPWEQNYDEWKLLLKSTINTLFINIVLIHTVLGYIIFYHLNFVKSSFFDSDIPNPFMCLLQVLFCVFCEDTYFYFVHRLGHTKYLYNIIHKVHHRHKQTVSFASEYAHPIEFIFVNLVQGLAGPIILGTSMHISTYATWIIYFLWESYESHSNYELPIRMFDILPGMNPAEYHIFHHIEFKGNYGGLFFWWDRIGHTVNESYIKYFYTKILNGKKYKGEEDVISQVHNK